MLNITKIPISKTSLNFTPTQQLQSSKSSNNYGGFGSKQAQNQALTNAIQASQKKYPDQFIDKKTGKTYAYVSQVTSKKTQAQNPMQLQKLKTTPKIQLQSFDTKFQKQQQGPIQPLGSMSTLSGSVKLDNTKSLQRQHVTAKPLLGGQGRQETYNEYSGNVPGQITDKLLDTVGRPIAEMGQGQKNIVEDYGNITNLEYEDKSLINRSIGQGFEGDYSGALETISSNPAQLAGELSIEIPLTILPVGPITKAAKIAGTGLRTVFKSLLSHPTVISSVTKADRINAEKLLDKIAKQKPNPSDVKKAEDMVKKLDKSIEKDIKKQLKPEYTKRYSKDNNAKNYEKLIKDDTADWAKAPNGLATDPNSLGIVKKQTGFLAGGFSKTGTSIKGKTGKTPLNQKIVDDILTAKWQGATAPKVLSKTGEAQLGKIIKDNPLKIGGAKKFITRSEAVKLKALAPFGVASAAVFYSLSPQQEAEAFPIGPVIKGASKVVKGGMSDFEKMYRQLPHDKQMNIFKNAFFSPNTQKIAASLNAKSTGLRTNTVKQASVNLKTLAKDPVKFKKAIRDYEQKNGLKPMPASQIIINRNLVKNSNNKKLTLGGIITGVIAGATNAFAGFGQLPQAYATHKEPFSGTLKEDAGSGIPWLTNNINSFTNSSISNSTGGRVPGNSEFNPSISNSTNPSGKVKVGNITFKSQSSADKFIAKNPNYNFNKQNKNTRSVTIGTTTFKNQASADKFIAKNPNYNFDKIRKTKTKLTGLQIRQNAKTLENQKKQLEKQKVSNNKTSPKALTNAEKKAKALASFKKKQLQGQTRAQLEAGINSGKVNSSYSKVSTINTEYANGPNKGLSVAVTSTQTNPYEELGNFSNPNFGSPPKKLNTKQGTSNKDKTKPKPIINPYTTLKNPYGNWSNDQFGL